MRPGARETLDTNCFAFAANDTQHVWQYTGPGKLGGYFWPDEVKGDAVEHHETKALCLEYSEVLDRNRT